MITLYDLESNQSLENYFKILFFLNRGRNQIIGYINTMSSYKLGLTRHCGHNLVKIFFRSHNQQKKEYLKCILLMEIHHSYIYRYAIA